MAVVVDTGMVMALYDRADANHDAAKTWISVVDEDLVTTPLAIAEMDHLIVRDGGERARLAFWKDLDVGAFAVRWWADGMDDTLPIARENPSIGLTAASLVALSAKARTDRIATFDQIFRDIRTPSGRPFVVLPGDASNLETR